MGAGDGGQLGGAVQAGEGAELLNVEAVSPASFGLVMLASRSSSAPVSV
jgi:hypothetical protein